MTIEELLKTAKDEVNPHVDNASIRLSVGSLGSMYHVEVWEFFGYYGGEGEAETLDEAVKAALDDLRICSPD